MGRVRIAKGADANVKPHTGETDPRITFDVDVADEEPIVLLILVTIGPGPPNSPLHPPLQHSTLGLDLLDRSATADRESKHQLLALVASRRHRLRERLIYHSRPQMPLSGPPPSSRSTSAASMISRSFSERIG